MTDRNARDQMAKVIRAYMSEEITAFQFDDALTETSNATNDKTVQAVGQALWFHYDDCTDHKVVASKVEWDYPTTIVGRKIRDPVSEKLMWVPLSIAWCLFSPVALFFQMLPERESETRIKLPESSALSHTLQRTAGRPM